jgi:hypothetical protein
MFDKDWCILQPAPLLLLFGLALSSCGASSAVADNKSLKGFENLEFGMTFDTAVALSGASLFNPAAYQNCMADKAIRGCLLSRRDNLIPYKTIEGVPYTLCLSFNRFDKLTDIDISFERRTIDGPEQEISEADCLQINDRTLDWVSKSFGPLNESKFADATPTPSASTAAGNQYWLNKTKSTTGFIAEANRTMPEGRLVSLLSTYMVTDSEKYCDVRVSFSDSEKIERWKLHPNEQAELDQITTQQ